MQQKKKKLKYLQTLPFTQDLLVYKPQTDKKIHEIAMKLKKLDEYDILSYKRQDNVQPQQINTINNLKLINDMQTKMVGNLDTAYRQWFFDDAIIYSTNQNLFKPKEIPISIKQTKVTSLQVFELRCTSNYYWEFEQIKKDLQKLFAWTYVYRVTEQCGYIYLVRLWEQVDTMLQRLSGKLQEDKANDMKNLFDLKQEFKIETENWPFVPSETRKYEVISDYEPNPTEEHFCELIWKKLKTEKKPIKCSAQCVCFTASQFGNFSLEKQTWNSKCANRANRVECEEHENTEEKCVNQSISQGKFKQIGKDVEESICWGTDIYTRNIIYFCLPSFSEEQARQDFISISLLKALNFQKDKGYDLDVACKFILENSRSTKQIQGSEIFQKVDRRFAKSVLYALKHDTERKAFRAHTKGVGIICKNQTGIQNNELIIQYFGEIYQPWRWFEKQDFIKKKMKDNNQKDVLPDFYNITLEIHKNDPKGLDLLVFTYNEQFVDPINKGNYSSRLSHSCDPNCGTVITVTNGQYTIGMFALKDISYGEELTFDYCSMTESKQEYKQALCLCGQQKCRMYIKQKLNYISRYLDLNMSKEQNNIMDKEHCFLRRNACLLRACMNHNEEIKSHPLFEFYNIKESVLEDCPNWLRYWAKNILEFVQQEEDLYIDEQANLGPHRNLEIIKFFATQFVESRIQNLIITLDKIKYYLQSCQDVEPPLSVISEKIFLEEMWGKWDKNIPQKNDQSIINELDYLFSRKIDRRNNQLDLLNIPQIQNCREIMQRTKILLESNQYTVYQKVMLTRLMFLCLSHIVFQIQQDTPVHFEALAIILFFMAFTYTYFRPHEYSGFQSVKFEIHEIEWGKIGDEQRRPLPKKSKKAEQRTYSSQFIWGQLVGWFKQTVANPQASLSQDRRGTLSYPSFVQSFESGGKSYPFQENKEDSNSRAYFLKHLLDKPSYMWPPETASWSYKNSYKIYGTVLFESVFSKDKLKDDFLEQIIKSVELDLDTKLNLFYMMENRMFNQESSFIRDHYQTHFKEFMGSPVLILPNSRFQDAQQNSSKIRKLPKEKKQTYDQDEPREIKLDVTYKQDDIIQRRKIEEYITNPKNKNFYLSKMHILSFDFTDFVNDKKKVESQPDQPINQ